MVKYIQPKTGIYPKKSKVCYVIVPDPVVTLSFRQITSSALNFSFKTKFFDPSEIVIVKHPEVTYQKQPSELEQVYDISGNLTFNETLTLAEEISNLLVSEHNLTVYKFISTLNFVSHLQVSLIKNIEVNSFCHPSNRDSLLDRFPQPYYHYLNKNSLERSWELPATFLEEGQP